MSHNPYAAPSADITAELPRAESADLALRQAHLQHEVQLKSVGTVCVSAAFVWGVSSAIGIPVYLSSSASEPAWLQVITVALCLLVLAAFACTGIGLRGLHAWVRIPAAAVAVPCLLLFPLGTLLGAYLIYLLFCAKGQTVLSPGYARVLAATSHLRYRRSGLERVLLALLLSAVIALLALIAWMDYRGAL